MSVKEAGRKGGIKTRESHDTEFYKEIGKKGGISHAIKIHKIGLSDEERNRLVEAGRKGGQTTKTRYGKEFYQQIGKKGGRRRSEHTVENID